jgi:hypothetical protein
VKLLALTLDERALRVDRHAEPLDQTLAGLAWASVLECSAAAPREVQIVSL